MGRDLIFSYDLAAYLFILIPIISFLYFSLLRYRKKTVEKFIPSEKETTLLIKRSIFFSKTKFLLLILAVICLIVVLMEPKNNLHYEISSLKYSQLKSENNEPTVSHTIYILVDTSASMSVEDSWKGQTRLKMVQEVLEELTSTFKGQFIALDAFTSEVTPIVPPNLDYLFLRLSIKNLSINEGGVEGSNFLNLMETIKKKLITQKENSLQSWILFSDGEEEQTDSKILFSSFLPSKIPSNLQWISIGVGSEKGGEVPEILFNEKPVFSQLHRDFMENLAKSFNGTYLEANKFSPFELAQKIKEKVDFFAKEQKKIEENQNKWKKNEQGNELVFFDFRPYLIFLALIFIGIAHCLPECEKK